MEFESRGSRNLWAVAAECQRGPAPSETFIYSIAAGWHFIDFHDFFGFMGFHEISWISSVRSRETCGGLCRRVPTRSCSFGNLYTRSQVAAISKIFHGFSRFSLDFMDFEGRGSRNLWSLCRRVPPRSCSFRNLHSIPAGCYFIDVRDCP